MTLDLSGKIARLSARLASAQDAEVASAVARSGLTLALLEALAGQAAEAARRREFALRLYIQSGVSRRRLGALSRLSAQLGAGGPAPALFDAGWYHTQNRAALAASRLAPQQHFIKAGAAAGLSPHPLFDVAHYLAQDPVLAAGEDPAGHYLRTGWTADLSPHPLFDPAWYAHQAQTSGPPLLHYLAEGARRGLSPHPLVDPAWCLERYPDLAQAGVEPLSHYLTLGAAEGRDPGPWFGTSHYVTARGEGLPPGSNPLVDYLQGGAWNVSEPRPGFATAAYLAEAPELARVGMTPLEHWARNAAA